MSGHAEEIREIERIEHCLKNDTYLDRRDTAKAVKAFRAILEERNQVVRLLDETKQKWYTSNKIILKRDEEVVQLREELEQVKEERDEWKSNAESAAEAARHCLYATINEFKKGDTNDAASGT